MPRPAASSAIAWIANPPNPGRWGEPAALALIPAAERPNVRHQGGRTVEVAQAAYARHGVNAEVTPFIQDMAGAYAWADLVVCRAGASTVAELATAGLASVLVATAAFALSRLFWRFALRFYTSASS